MVNDGIFLTGIKDKFFTELVKNNTIIKDGQFQITVKDALTANIRVNMILVIGNTGEDLSFSECESLINIGKNINLQLLSYTDEYELLFKLGTLMNKESTYVISEENKKRLASLFTSNLSNDYKIYVSSVKSKTGIPMPKTTQKRKNCSGNNSGRENIVKNSFSNLSEQQIKKNNKLKKEKTSDVTKSDIVKTENKVENNEVKTQKYKQVERKIDKEVKEIEPNITRNINDTDKNIGNKTTTGILNTITDIAEKGLKTEPGKYPEEIIKIFLKRSGVRSSDLHDWEGDDEELATELMDITRDTFDKKNFQEILNNKYSEKDAQYLFKWMGSNLVKLHDTSLGILK